MTFNFEPTAGYEEKSFRNASRFQRLTSLLAGIICFALLQTCIQASEPAPATYSLDLAWNPSVSPEVTSYLVYYGTNPGNYNSSIRLNEVTTATVSGLSFGTTYYFAITAADADGVESDFSNEISYLQQLPVAQIQGHMSDGQFVLTVTGTAGHTYDFEATQDFTTWTVIGTGTVDTSGSLEFTDPEAGNFQQRFYRTRDTQP